MRVKEETYTPVYINKESFTMQPEPNQYLQKYNPTLRDEQSSQSRQPSICGQFVYTDKNGYKYYDHRDKQIGHYYAQKSHEKTNSLSIKSSNQSSKKTNVTAASTFIGNTPVKKSKKHYRNDTFPNSGSIQRKSQNLNERKNLTIPSNQRKLMGVNRVKIDLDSFAISKSLYDGGSSNSPSVNRSQNHFHNTQQRPKSNRNSFIDAHAQASFRSDQSFSSRNRRAQRMIQNPNSQRDALFRKNKSIMRGGKYEEDDESIVNHQEHKPFKNSSDLLRQICDFGAAQIDMNMSLFDKEAEEEKESEFLRQNYQKASKIQNNHTWNYLSKLDGSNFEKLNRFCFECQQKDPQWCSINNGIFICFDCSEFHKGYEDQISLVRSLENDQLRPIQVKMLQIGGNKKFLEFTQLYMMAKKDSDQHSKYYRKACSMYRDKLAHCAEQDLEFIVDYSWLDELTQADGHEMVNENFFAHQQNVKGRWVWDKPHKDEEYQPIEEAPHVEENHTEIKKNGILSIAKKTHSRYGSFCCNTPKSIIRSKVQNDGEADLSNLNNPLKSDPSNIKNWRQKLKEQFGGIV